MNPYRHRVLLVVIGASATALALFAFSGAWCLVVSSCGLEGEACDATFWEVFGLAGGSMIGFLMINPIRKQFERRSPRRVPPSTTFRSEDQGLSSPLPSGFVAEEVGCACDPQPAVCNNEPGERWRALYAQMSPEEQKEFKRMMQQLCTRSDRAPEQAEVRAERDAD